MRHDPAPRFDDSNPGARPETVKKTVGQRIAGAPSSVRELLHRDLYYGVILWNRTRKRDPWVSRNSGDARRRNGSNSPRLSSASSPMRNGSLPMIVSRQDGFISERTTDNSWEADQRTRIQVSSDRTRALRFLWKYAHRPQPEPRQKTGVFLVPVRRSTIADAPFARTAWRCICTMRTERS